MVLDTARPKHKENTMWPGMRGRDAARKSTPEAQVFTIDFSEIQFIANHEKKCKEWDELAKEDHTYKLTPEERRRCKGQFLITEAAVLMKIRLHHETGEPIEEPIHPGEQRRIQQGQEVFSDDYFSSARVDQHTGWEYWPSSTSSFVVVRILIGVGSELTFFELLRSLFFCYS